MRLPTTSSEGKTIRPRRGMRLRAAPPPPPPPRYSPPPFRLLEPKRYQYPQTPRRPSPSSRPSSRTSTSPSNRLSFNVDAPAQGRKGRASVGMLVASERWLDGLFGEISLACTRAAIDLERLSLGQLSFCIDHDTSAPIGRIVSASIRERALYADAEVANTPFAKAKLLEIDEGIRNGVSPGFLIAELRAVERDDPDYSDDTLRIVVERWQPYEVSSTPIPRNPMARITNRGRFSMGQTEYVTTAALGVSPELVSTDDLDGLSLTVGRKLLESGMGDKSKLGKLERFFVAYDRAIGSGQSRIEAIEVGKRASGIV